MNKKKLNAFTMVELVITIAIIAILAAVLIPTFVGIIKRTNDNAIYQQAVAARDEYLSGYVDDPVDLMNSIIKVKIAAHKETVFSSLSRKYICVLLGFVDVAEEFSRSLFEL